MTRLVVARPTRSRATGSARRNRCARCPGLWCGPGRYAAHIATVLPNHLMMEVLDVGRDAVFTTDHVMEGGEIVLVGLSRNVEKFLDEMRMEEFWEVFHNVEEAKGHLIGQTDSGRA